MASKYVFHVGDQDFDKEVLQSDVVTVVDFWAEWCRPCRALAPVLEQLAEEYDGKVRVAKLDVDSNPEVSVKYKISAIPTIMAFKGGESVGRLRGPSTRDLKGFFSEVTSYS